MTIEPPDESREIVTHAAENEIFLSFNDDIDAELFSEWWNSKGWEAFKEWGEKEKAERQ